jgi:hypothetical protein
MSYTLIMTWDIKPEMEQEYYEFVIREWVPVTNRLGLEMVAAWYTQYSVDNAAPLIRAEGIAEDIQTMRTLLSSQDWQDIHVKLMDYVENYSHKVVETTGDFRL